MKSLRKFWFWAIIPATVGLILFGIGCGDDGGDGGGDTGAQWTIMMYGAGNNNLDVSNNNTSFIIQDVQDMEKVGSQSGMNIVAMVASQRTGGTAKYYHIEYHPNENPDQISSTELANKGTKDMSDPATLVEFLNYCKANYPANKYLLIVDDHGAGWPGSCSDELNGGGGLLTMPELRNAIAGSSLQRVDILTWHACLMAMVEVGYELRNVASYMTGCQFTMPMQNVLGADLWLAWLKDNTGASAEQLAQKIAEKVRQAAENKQKTTHYAMIKLSEMQALGARIGNFGNVLVTEGGQYWNEVQHAWSQTHTTQYDNPTYVDLREFANKIRAEEHLSQINLINNAAADIISGVNAAVPFTSTYFYPPDQPVPRGGLNIHFPYQLSEFDSANYVGLEFRATNWQAFLSTFLRNTGQQPTQGRCCYNNNQNCAVNTQAECAQLGGNWTQGIDCNTPCQQGANCPTVCAQAQRLTLGVPVSNCQFTAQDQWHWFVVAVASPHTYRFQLGDFVGNADFDLYSFVQCSDFPSTPFGCSSDQAGPEDFTCQISSGAGDLSIGIRAYSGTGGYTLLVSQVSGPGEISDQPAPAPLIGVKP